MKRLFLSLAVAAGLLAPVATMVPAGAIAPAQQFAAACPGANLLTFQNWYAGLNCDSKGVVDITHTQAGKNLGLNGIWVIVLNVMDDVIQAMGYVAVGFIIWGGIKYLKSQGDPGEVNDARNVITNALIGLGIILAAVAMVRFVTSNL